MHSCMPRLDELLALMQLDRILEKQLVESASLPRRLAAMIYDGLLLLSLWFITSGLFVLINNGVALTPLQSQLFLFPSLFIVLCFFYIWFWTHGGQTLGMRTWKIKLVNDQGQKVNLQDCLLRILSSFLSFACLGLGYFWIYFDSKQSTWHDHLSKTRIILLPNP